MGLLKFIRQKTRRRRAPTRRPTVAVEAGNWYRWRIRVENLGDLTEDGYLSRAGYRKSHVRDLRMIRSDENVIVFEYTAFQIGDGTIALGKKTDVSGPGSPELLERVMAVHLVPKPR